MNLSTFPHALLEHAARRPGDTALREKAYGIWQTTTWEQLTAQVRLIACGLAGAGLQSGQHLAVIGENRPRLMAAMLAAQCLGAIPVPLYQDAAAAEFAFPLADAEMAAIRRGRFSPITARCWLDWRPAAASPQAISRTCAASCRQVVVCQTP